MPLDTKEAVRRLCVGLGLSFDDAQVERLAAYLALLQRWNGTYNLTAVRDPAEMLVQHVADCLAVVPPLARWRQEHPEVRRLLDVGSGGGLPGVVLAIAEPELRITCIDTVGKKAAFVRQAGLELRLANLTSLHGRVESLREQPFDLVVSRAFASLADFVRWTEHSVSDAGTWLAMKGKVPREEMADLPSPVEVFHVEQLQVPGLDAERCLVWMRRRAASAPQPG